MSNNEEGNPTDPISGSHSNTNNVKLDEKAQSEITVVTDLHQQQRQVIDHGGSDENIINNSVDPENLIHEDGTNNISNNETNNNATDMTMMEDARITASTLASTTTSTEENSPSSRQHNSTTPVGVSVDGSTTYESTTVETVAAAIAAAEAVNEEVSNIPAALPMNLDQGGLPVEVEHRHHHHTNMEQHGGAKDVNAGVGTEVVESMDLQNHVMNHTGDNNNTIAQSHDQAAAAAAVAEATAVSIMNFNNFVPQDHAQSQHCVGLEGETHQIVGTEVLPSLPPVGVVGDGTTPDSLVVNDQYAASHHHHVDAMMGTATGVVSNTGAVVGIPMAPQDAAAVAPSGKLSSNGSITESELAALDPNAKHTYHGRQLAIRRVKDRNRYWSMSSDERNARNAKRREKYKHQRVMEKEAEQAPDGEGANPDLFHQIINRKKVRRDKERERYHALDEEAKKVRNQKRAARERERYHALTPEEKADRNRRRRERAAELRARKKQKAEHNTETISAANATESEGLVGVDVGSIVPTIEGTVEDGLVSSVSPDALQLAVQTAKDSMEQHLHDHAVSTSLSEADSTDAAAATAAAAAISASSAVIGGSNITAL